MFSGHISPLGTQESSPALETLAVSWHFSTELDRSIVAPGRGVGRGWSEKEGKELGLIVTSVLSTCCAFAASTLMKTPQTHPLSWDRVKGSDFDIQGSGLSRSVQPI